tara:strand:- start:2556 stop:3017 length:462 start_codon:yes stop_codon:yes gene_type:complete
MRNKKQMNDKASQSETSETYDLDEQVGYILRLASQRHAGIFQNIISKDLTPTQFSVLIRLAEKGDLSQNLLGRLAALDTATTKGVVDRLRAKALIQSRPDTSDKRRAIISLTDEGQSIISSLKKDGLAITDKTLGSLKATEKLKLLKLLKKII